MAENKDNGMVGVVQRDWENREFIETIQQSILQIVTFLNQFDVSTRYRLAQVQAKLTRLERHLDYLEASISQSDPRVREAEAPKVVAPAPVAYSEPSASADSIPSTPNSQSTPAPRDEGVPPQTPSLSAGPPPAPGAGPGPGVPPPVPSTAPPPSPQPSTSSAPPPNPMLANGGPPNGPPGGPLGVPRSSPPPPPGAGIPGGRPPPVGRPSAPIPIPGVQPPMPGGPGGRPPPTPSPGPPVQNGGPGAGGPPPRPAYLNGGGPVPVPAGPVPVPGQQPPQPPGGAGAGRPPPQALGPPPTPGQLGQAPPAPMTNGSRLHEESRSPSPVTVNGGGGEYDHQQEGGSEPVTPRDGSKKKRKKKREHRHRRMKLGENKDISLKVLKEGDGQNFPHSQSVVIVDYTGYLSDGSKFDTSVDYTIALGTRTVVEGLEIVLQEMSLGSRASFKIPSYLAYGSSGAPGVIPPDCDLKFDLELKEIQS